MGRRVDLGPSVSRKVTEDNVLKFNRGLGWKLFYSWLKRDTPNLFRALRIPWRWARAVFGRDKVPDLLGSNFSVTTKLLFEVNGYNEDYRSYWGEDGDLFIRLRNSGAKLVGSKSMAVQFHLDHPRLSPDLEHQCSYQVLLADRNYKRCVNGISSLSPEAVVPGQSRSK